MYGKLAIIVAVAGISALSAHKVTQWHADARYNEFSAQVERDRRDLLERAIKRHKELTARLEQVQRDYEKKKADFDANLSDANAVNKRLLQQLDKRRAASVTTVTSCGNSAGRSGDVPAELFTGANDAAGELAEYADRVTLALGACRDAYHAAKF